MQVEQLTKQGSLPYHAGGGLLCMGLLAIAWFVGVAPMMHESNAGASVMQQASAAQAEADKAKSELDQLGRELEAVRAELDKQPVSLEPASALNPLLAQLAQWADAHGLSITQTKPGRTQQLQYYDFVPIQVSGEGRYADLLAYFHRLRTSRGDLGIIGFHAARMTGGNASGLTFEVHLAWYVLSQEDQDPASGGPATALVPTDG